MNEQQIAAEAKLFWRENFPKSYKRLVGEGRLEREAIATAKLTLVEMESHMLLGATELEAWEASRGLFVMTDPLD